MRVVAAAHLGLEAALVGQALEADLVERIGGVAVFDTYEGTGVVRMGQLDEKKESRAGDVKPPIIILFFVFPLKK